MPSAFVALAVTETTFAADGGPQWVYMTDEDSTPARIEMTELGKVVVRGIWRLDPGGRLQLAIGWGDKYPDDFAIGKGHARAVLTFTPPR